MANALSDAVSDPVKAFTSLPGVGEAARASQGLFKSTRRLASGLPSLAKQATTPAARSLNGPIGPNRRWAWTDAEVSEFKQAKNALGGTVNDVVLAAITRGFRDLLDGRGELHENSVVRSMVPVSVRKPDQRGNLDNQVSAVFVDLPVGERDPLARLTRIRQQMDEYKGMMKAVDVPSIIALGNFVAPALLAMGVRAGIQVGQFWAQAVTTNVPGPPVPLYVLGRKMCSANAYVPIAGGTRVSIGIFSYLNGMTFGINADFDAFPDVDVLAAGIRRGVDELLERAPSEAATATR
jgi:WS/DGAT/MGAT family acyltransferase